MAVAKKLAEETLKEQNLVRIPFSKLQRWSGNVRTVKSATVADKELIANIRVNGVLQALVVFKAEGKKEVYMVAAGGRRYGSLEVLFAEGAIKEDTLIDCNLVEEKDALAISLAENLKESMHPADSFVAYKAMVDSGKSVAEVAKQFGKSKTDVEKLLKLASVAPDIIEVFKAGKMSLDTVMAFTVIEDHSKQLECFNGNKKNLHAHIIRSQLLASTLSSNDRLVKFITLQAYKKAGGSVTNDMFNQNTVYLNDIQLVNELAATKLQEAAVIVSAEGWKWSEASLSYLDTHKYRTVHGEFVGLPAEIDQKIVELEKERDELWELDETTDEQDERQSEIDTELETLEESKEAYRKFTPEQLAHGGVGIYLDGEGTLVVRRGLFRKEDFAAYTKAQNPEQGESSGDDDSGSAPEVKGTESEALLVDLGDYKAQAIHAELAQNPDAAYDLLVYTMASRLIEVGYGSPLELRPQMRHFNAADINLTKAAKVLDDIKAALPLSWLEIEDEAEQFTAFGALSKNEKNRIMAYCVSIATTTGAKRENGVMSALLKRINFDLNKYWAPTAENYFGRVSKDTLLKIGGDIEGEEWAKQSAGSKKSELAKLLPTLEKIKGWLPACLS